jgi:hypothetical protein
MLLEDLKLNMRTARANRMKSEQKDNGAGFAPWTHFRAWSKGRPFIGSVLVMVAGVEMFFSGQLDLGNIKVQVGVAGLQSTIIPVVMVLLGLLVIVMPVHRIFYGVIALALSVYSLIGLNLGGFFIGMILGAVGGVIVVSWIPKKVAVVIEEPAQSVEAHEPVKSAAAKSAAPKSASTKSAAPKSAAKAPKSAGRTAVAMKSGQPRNHPEPLPLVHSR